MELEITEFLDETDRVRLFEWREQVFPVEGRAYRWSETSHHVIARSSGEAVAHLGFGRFELLDGGRTLAVIGVGGVVVRPEHQGRRIPSLLFDVLHSTPVLDARETTCTLFCPERLVPYYSGHGYTDYSGEVNIPWGDGTKVIDLRFMYRGQVEFSPSITLTTDPW